MLDFWTDGIALGGGEMNVVGSVGTVGVVINVGDGIISDGEGVGVGVGVGVGEGAITYPLTSLLSNSSMSIALIFMVCPAYSGEIVMYPYPGSLERKSM